MEEGSAILPMFSRRPLVTSEVTQRGSEAGESTGGSAATGKQQKDGAAASASHTHIHTVALARQDLVRHLVLPGLAQSKPSGSG